MFDNATEKTLRLIAAGVHLKQVHGLEFALLMLIDAGFLEEVARAALQNERFSRPAGSILKHRQSADIHPE
ncbi:hypothetical protein O0880_14440 [Janthinobacterium sp. SUN118]|uniref:hypothetical protein n=1 Tax=Janthinobacterium sp. SUN118 TaxID=3004100 RepID=UPI0025B16F14|nr:hypothetical protein [Janthinobacterium sp. SUN118]MDN2710620.1 hypothetical protein [Janthinobacterium sp. SUN118]